MANMMLNPHSNGYARKVGELMNLSAGNPKDTWNHQVPVNTESQRTWKKSLFDRFIAPRNSWPIPSMHMFKPGQTLRIPPKVLQTPDNARVSYTISVTRFDGLAGSDHSHSRRKPSTEEMPRVDLCTDALASAGTSGVCLKSAFSGERCMDSFLGSPDLSPMPGGEQPGPQGPFQGGATAAVSPLPSPAANFDDEDPLPREPVDCWEDLVESSPVEEKAVPVEVFGASPAPCENTETCFEGKNVLDAQAGSDILTQDLQLADSPADRELHKEIKAKTPAREISQKCSKKPEQSDLSKVLYDRKAKPCGKNKKRKRQLKKSKKCSSGPDQESKCMDAFSALEDSDSDGPPASLAKDQLEGDDEEDFDFLNSGLGFCGLGDFLPGCQKPAKPAPPPPPCPDPLRSQDPEFAPSARIQKMNQAWGIDPAVPWERPPRKSRVCFAKGQDLATEYVQEDWDPDYRAACVGHWHLLAVDRQRFQERIARVGQQVEWVLAPQHRAAVYAKHFCSPEEGTH